YFCRAGGNRPDGLNEPVTDFTSQGILFVACVAIFTTGKAGYQRAQSAQAQSGRVKVKGTS
ncbi:hypothetical protein, partial [Escherichia coli]|uniref:hypothetical protein n=1 Tax=Escherichia coli TaxID=562 RepID=UPI001BC86274